MKTHSNDLFLLIKSLEPQEKRYFLLYASNNSEKTEKSFLHLFNAIASQKEYDEKKVIEYLKKKGVLSVKSFSSLKKYVYDTLLKWLNVYSSDANELNRVRNMISSAHLLKDKVLYEQSEKILEKAKVIAYRDEFLRELEVIIRLQLNICGVDPKMKGKAERLRALYTELGEIIQLNQKDYQYLGLNVELATLFLINAKDDTGEELRRLRKLQEHPLLQDDELATTNFMKRVFYNSHLRRAMAEKDHISAFGYSYKFIRLMEKTPSILQSDIKLYMIYLNNHLTYCINVDKRRDFLETLDKLRSLKCTTMEEKAMAFYFSTQNELCYYTKYQEYNIVLAQVKKIESQLAVYKGMYSKQFEFCVIVSLVELFFLVKNYKESRRWLMMFLEDEDAKESLDIYVGVRLFYLVILLESREDELLESQLRSVHFLFKKNNWLHEFENFILGFIKSELNGKSDKRKILAELPEIKTRIKEGTYKTVEHRVFYGFNFIDWIEKRARE